MWVCLQKVLMLISVFPEHKLKGEDTKLSFCCCLLLFNEFCWGNHPGREVYVFWFPSVCLSHIVSIMTYSALVKMDGPWIICNQWLLALRSERLSSFEVRCSRGLMQLFEWLCWRLTIITEWGDSDATSTQNQLFFYQCPFRDCRA